MIRKNLTFTHVTILYNHTSQYHVASQHVTPWFCLLAEKDLVFKPGELMAFIVICIEHAKVLIRAKKVH